METEDLREYLGIALDMEKNIYLRKRLIDTLSEQRDQMAIPKAFTAPVKPQQQTQGMQPQVDQDYLAAWNRYTEERSAYFQNIAKDKVRFTMESRQRVLLSQEVNELVRHQAESENRLEQIYGKNIIFPKYRNLVALSSLYEYICAGRCYALEGPEGAYNIYETESRFDKLITQLDQVIVRLDAIRDNQYVLFSTMQEANRQYETLLDAVQTMAQQGARLLSGVQSISHQISEHSCQVFEQTNRIVGQTARLSTQLSGLQETSALAAYHAERTQKELHYMNQMDFWSGRNDAVFFNLPPH